jgi:hypothetical protein
MAGTMYLAYIALAFPSMILYGRATRGTTIDMRLAQLAAHAAEMRIATILTVSTALVAITLAVGLYGITRDHDHELAVVALCCRVGEGVINAIAAVGMLALLSIAASTELLEPAATRGAAAVLMRQNWGMVGALLFACGSTVFSWLMLRGRVIPTRLAWLGVIASVILVIGLPMQIGGILRGSISQLMWIPMAAFEIPVGIWLIVKGVEP